MKIKFIVPKMKETFGRLEFAGDGEVIYEGFGRDQKAVGRSYQLYSPLQRAVTVILPAKVEEKKFEYEEEVKLVNPKIVYENKRGYISTVLYADNLVKA